MKNKRFFYLLVIACSLSFFQCDDDDEAPKMASKEILSFKFSSLTPEVVGSINEAEKKITLVVPHGTDVTALTPVIEVAEKATVSPASGAAQNFSAPVTYTVTAENGTTQDYVVTVSQAEACLPTTLPSDEAYLKITYNTAHTNGEHTVDFIEFLNYDDPEPGRYTAKFTYTNGKLSRIDHLDNNVVESYVTFEYPNGKIIENHFNRTTLGGNLEKELYYVYYLQDNRIISWGSHAMDDDYAMGDSAVFTYNGAGNITHIDSYNENSIKSYTTDLEYDAKLNPYKLSGVYYGDNEFYNPFNISANNITKGISKDLLFGDESDESFSYTYDAAGRPLTRNVDWEGINRTIAYTCH